MHSQIKNDLGRARVNEYSISLCLALKNGIQFDITA